MKTQGSVNWNWESILSVLANLAVVLLSFYAWRIHAANRRLLLEADELNMRLANSNVRANAMVIMYDELRAALDRRTVGYNRARQAFVEQRAAARELQQALLLAANDLGAGYQAQVELRQHVERCPLNDEIYVQEGSRSWHRDDHCDELYESGREIHGYQACAICARQELVVPGEDEMQFFTEHGVRVVNAPEGMFH